MSTLRIASDGATWDWAPPDPVLAGERFRAIMEVSLVDEVTDRPFDGRARVSTSLAHATARITANLAGISGRPSALFAPAGIAAAPLDLAIEALGYLRLDLHSTMGAQPGFPAAFAPRQLGTVALHRTPTTLFGRVMAANGTPLVGATVTLTGVWRTLAATGGAAQTPDLMPTATGVYADRSGAASLRRRNFTPAVEAKTILGGANAGASEIVLSDRVAIAAGDVLMIEPDLPEAELVLITALDTSSSADQPARAQLAFPLSRRRMPGAAAMRAVSGAGGANNALSRPARRADLSVFTNGLAGIGPGTGAIEISGGGPADPEFHFATQYVATSTTGGAYALPALHRLAAVQLRATHAMLATPIMRRIDLEFGVARQRADLVAA